MAVPTSIDDLSATAASNGPDGATDLPSAYDDYIRAVSAFIRQLRDGKEFPPLLSSVSGTDTITASAPAAITAYAAGQRFSFVASATNTGAVTLNINSLGAKDVTKRGTTALVAGDITSGQIVLVEYDGTRFQLVGATSSASDTVSGIVELATNAEAQTGTDATRAVTPAALASVTATETRAGLVELATTAEAQTATDTARAITPAGLKAAQIVQPSAPTVTGTAIDFTSIPSWVKRVTVLFSGLSGSGTSNFMVQLGTASGFETSGYSGIAVRDGGSGNVYSSAFSSGFLLRDSVAAANTYFGRMVFERIDSTTWVATGTNTRAATDESAFMNGAKTLSGALTQVRFTTVGGADTFDAGAINCLYE